ncbi:MULTISPECIES: sugar transferase [Sulfitobacter]|uniref:sugar transferase n=1 Tax=Sulfitobacter TaxID=60136 RepID=UPI002306F144|nr:MULTISPECIES: sugar transferase [Sulfitobacter]MDF3381977.1 sugar transferase [Sulfitobacter sp. Ks11]MDF3385396.1 sugar transferase [Sulfitobacter sp. M85]MDF3388815.1 sugar transferase [Sulfitobacter sp. Ks16]MDF3399452.1 sugar transferase [Sulfitobacter sp. KE39]MDF3402873.1 sugar transferase [Sulfitobacter sp. Ks35]
MTWRKRIFDLFFASLLVIILGPILLGLLVWLLVKEGRPLFHVAERMKTPEESFKLWKLRTMTVAEEDQGVSGGNKTARITPTGAWLRARRLDEFPQLWNILRGDLSFVGPRPPLREYVERFPEVYADVLKSRPGVTGLATIRFHKHEERLLSRCETAAETDRVYCRTCVPRKAQLDLIYQRHQSICFDFALMLQTVQNFFSRG